MKVIDNFENIKKITFQKKPISIAPEYRPLYKIAEIILILKICSKNNKASLLKLHLFSWALRSSSNMDKVINLITNNYNSDFSIWGIEPSLNRALSFAVFEGLCNVVDGHYILNEKGEQFYNALLSDEDLFIEERRFLNFIGKNKLTEYGGPQA